MRSTFRFFPLFSLVLILSCSSTQRSGKQTAKLLDGQTFILNEFSSDPNYGYAEKKPIEVGGIMDSDGPLNERRFLNALAGPNGEPLSYERLGSCCTFKTKNSPFKKGLLDRYEVTWEGNATPVILYLNMYDAGPLRVPVNFTLKSKKNI